MFILSYIRPDKTAEVHPRLDVTQVRNIAYRFMIDLPNMTNETAWQAALGLSESQPGTEIGFPDLGVTFRIDSADNPPNVCPCCSGLVRPGDHAHAGQEDAYCLGCFTWDRNTPQCLPENTAHPVGYDPDKEG